MRHVAGRVAGVVGVVAAVTATAWLLLAVLRPDLFPPDPRPLPVRLGAALWDAARFEFGPSTAIRGAPDVGDLLLTGVPADLQLLLGGMGCGLGLGMGAAVACAGRPDGPLSQVLGAVAVVAQCVPIYVVALFLLFTLGEQIGTLGLPVGIPLRYVEFEDAGPVRWLAAIVTPWVVLSLPLAAVVFRMMRGSMRDTEREDFVLAARAKGLRPFAVRLRHQARFALAPTLSLTGAAMNATIVNLAIVEQVFGAPGSFRFLDDAVASADVGLLLGLTVLTATYVAVATMAVDLALRWLDPRVRVGGR